MDENLAERRERCRAENLAERLVAGRRKLDRKFSSLKASYVPDSATAALTASFAPAAPQMARLYEVCQLAIVPHAPAAECVLSIASNSSAAHIIMVKSRAFERTRATNLH